MISSWTIIMMVFRMCYHVLESCTFFVLAFRDNSHMYRQRFAIFVLLVWSLGLQQ